VRYTLCGTLCEEQALLMPDQLLAPQPAACRKPIAHTQASSGLPAPLACPTLCTLLGHAGQPAARHGILVSGLLTLLLCYSILQEYGQKEAQFTSQRS
jgi:hypothetical protein